MRRIGTVLMLLLVIMIFGACTKPTTTPTPEQTSEPATTPIPEEASEPATTPTPTLTKITLADATIVLDMSSELPASFERLDAASEGMSNKDLELGPDFSEVELFLSEEPFLIVFAYYTIIESRVEQAGADALMRDEEQVKSIVLLGLQEGAAEEGDELTNITIELTHPSIGDIAVLGSGTAISYGVSVGYDILMFKSNKVYVWICSAYLEGEGMSLLPLAQGIEQRIGMFSQ